METVVARYDNDVLFVAEVYYCAVVSEVRDIESLSDTLEAAVDACLAIVSWERGGGVEI